MFSKISALVRIKGATDVGSVHAADWQFLDERGKGKDGVSVMQDQADEPEAPDRHYMPMYLTGHQSTENVKCVGKMERANPRPSFKDASRVNSHTLMILLSLLCVILPFETLLAQDTMSMNQVSDEQRFVLTSNTLSPIKVGVPRKLLVQRNGLSDEPHVGRVSFSFFLPEDDAMLQNPQSLTEMIRSETEQKQALREPFKLRDWILLSLKYEMDVSMTLRSWDMGRSLEATHKMVGFDESGRLEVWAHDYDYKPDDALTFRPIGEKNVKFLCLFADRKYQCTLSYITHGHLLVSASVPRRMMSSWSKIISLLDKIVTVTEYDR